MDRIRLGFARLVLVYAGLVFLSLASVYLLRPLTGMWLDGVSERQWGELTNEGLSWIAFAVATWAAFRTGTAPAAGTPAEAAR